MSNNLLYNILDTKGLYEPAMKDFSNPEVYSSLTALLLMFNKIKGLPSYKGREKSFEPEYSEIMRILEKRKLYESEADRSLVEYKNGKYMISRYDLNSVARMLIEKSKRKIYGILASDMTLYESALVDEEKLRKTLFKEAIAKLKRTKSIDKSLIPKLEEIKNNRDIIMFSRKILMNKVPKLQMS